ncbi:ATP-dependent Clp protease adapter protein ClpS [Bartonella silvatica]|uniref:ATP-dependent Clp protease adapter protein ClpS n=1 Tax=Bartonella silvatica TaxID=357760 RepID=A0ABV2HHP9_9HYPH
MHDEKGKNWDKSRHNAIMIRNIRQKFQQVKLYGVFLLNDDFSSTDFIVFILIFFSSEEVTDII